MNNKNYVCILISLFLFSYSFCGHLINANLSGNNLEGYVFDNLVMTCVHLSNTNLTNASFQGSHLKWADLQKAILHRTNFTNANMYGIKLSLDPNDGHLVKGAIFKNVTGLHREQKEYLRKYGAVHVPENSNDDLYKPFVGIVPLLINLVKLTPTAFFRIKKLINKF